MTKESLAEMLNNRPYGDEITEAEELAARDAGLVVVFGYSDDNTEFRGAIKDEVGCYGGVDIYLTASGPLTDHADCECQYCGYKEAKTKARLIVANFDKGAYTWETDIPHATFRVLEDGDVYCQGIVFHISDL
jgi:hypothetical protein